MTARLTAEQIAEIERACAVGSDIDSRVAQGACRELLMHIRALAAENEQIGKACEGALIAAMTRARLDTVAKTCAEARAEALEEAARVCDAIRERAGTADTMGVSEAAYRIRALRGRP